MSDESVTVVIPTKNRRNLLARTLFSVLRQHGVELSVIVVDDGSDDDTAAFVRAHPDSRVQLVRHERSRGVSCARNAGLERVQSRWASFVDDDDVWSPSKLQHQLAAVRESDGSRWSASGAAFIDSDNSVLWIQHPVASPVLPALLRINTIPGGGSGVLVETEFVVAVGGFDADLSILADWDLWIRLAQGGEPALVPATDIGYYQHATSMSLDLSRSRRENAHIFEKYRSLYEAHGEPGESAEWHQYLGDVCLRNRQRRQALAEYARAGTEIYSRKEVAGKIAISILFPRGLNRLRRWWLSRQPMAEIVMVEAWLRHIPTASALLTDPTPS
ncbi:MAG: glycosyltransferase [Ilumatobacter sp.]